MLEGAKAKNFFPCTTGKPSRIGSMEFTKC
jgi:hypothetical protein